MNEALLPEYRQYRNILGGILAAFWLWYEHGKLAEARDAALAHIGTCAGLFEGAKCWFQREGVQNDFNGAMFQAVLLAPLAWVIAHYIAQSYVKDEARKKERQAEREERDREEAEREESAERLARAARSTAKAKAKIDRSEFIHKLGAVNDFLSLLEQEGDANRIATIRQGAALALRDLVAKHSVRQLKTMVNADAALALSLKTTLDVLARSPLAEAAEVKVLVSSLPAAATVAAE